MCVCATHAAQAHAVPCLVMSFCFACTRLVSSSFPRALGMDQTLFWGGDFSDWPFALIQVQSAS